MDPYDNQGQKRTFSLTSKGKSRTISTEDQHNYQFWPKTSYELNKSDLNNDISGIGFGDDRYEKNNDISMNVHRTSSANISRNDPM